MSDTRYAGVAARKMKPTQKHRIALYPGILGTVSAVAPTGETRYFDFDWAGAAKFAGITPASDPRVWGHKLWVLR